jgi:hypothetical protein
VPSEEQATTVAFVMETISTGDRETTVPSTCDHRVTKADPLCAVCYRGTTKALTYENHQVVHIKTIGAVKFKRVHWAKAWHRNYFLKVVYDRNH